MLKSWSVLVALVAGLVVAGCEREAPQTPGPAAPVSPTNTAGMAAEPACPHAAAEQKAATCDCGGDESAKKADCPCQKEGAGAAKGNCPHASGMTGPGPADDCPCNKKDGVAGAGSEADCPCHDKKAGAGSCPHAGAGAEPKAGAGECPHLKAAAAAPTGSAK